MYIHELNEWPKFTWNSEQLLPLLVDTKKELEMFSLELSKLGFEDQSEASLRVLTEEVVKTSEIEGNFLEPAQVRSSIAQKLGLPSGGLQKEDRNVEGIVNVVLDATRNCDKPLSQERLCSWHASLFPSGYSGIQRILVGQWRDDRNGPMQVVSGHYGNPIVHFEAPNYLRLPLEMENFISWFEQENAINPFLKAGIAHFYFVTLHPFDDGNGRIARAIADLVLARADNMSQRYYSMSAQIRIDKQDYYHTLETSQKAGLDITIWLDWFLGCLIRAIQGASLSLKDILQKSRVWQRLKDHEINDRQRKILNLLLDGKFFGSLNSSKYSKIGKCSTDTANRDLSQLENYGILERHGKGKATRYTMVPLPFEE